MLIFHGVILSQNITHTLGSSGLFRIKDAANTYLTLTQSNGYVELTKSLKLANTTTSTTGIIFKNTTRFIHDYSEAGTSGNNVFIGLNSGNFTLAGTSFEASFNVALGTNTLNDLTTGYNNVSIGSGSMSLTTTGFQNTAVGTNALGDNTSGSDNSAVGNSSLANNTTGHSNSTLGSSTLFSNTTGKFNIAIGNAALYENTTGLYSVAIGYYALALSTAGSNTAVGYQSLSSTTSGYRVTGLGYQSLTENTTGYDNTALGYSTLSSNTVGTKNTALGSLAGNIITSGDNLTLLGFNAQPTSVSANNQVTLGNNEVTSLRCNVQTITSLSDARDKKNINDLSLGLDFIMHLKPRQFNWDKREWYDNNVSDGSRTENDPTAGFIAQELDSVQNEFNADWLNLILKDNPEKWEATYGNLLPVMVKAMQELKNEYEELKQANMRLAQEISELRLIEVRLAELEAKIMKQDPVKEIRSAEK